jgi:hypothetical protein
MFRKSAAKKLPASFASFTGQGLSGGGNGFSCTRMNPPSDAVGVVSPNFYKNAPLKGGWLATDCYPKNKDCKQNDPQGCCYPWILTNTPYYMFASDGDPITTTGGFLYKGKNKDQKLPISVKFVSVDSQDDVGVVYGGQQYYMYWALSSDFKYSTKWNINLGTGILTLGNENEVGRPFTTFNWIGVSFDGTSVVSDNNFLDLSSGGSKILFKFSTSSNSDGSYVDPVATHTFQDRTLYYTPGLTCNELNPQCCTDPSNPRNCSSGGFACAVLSSPDGSNDDPSFVNYGPDYICPGSSSGCGRHTGL